MRRDFLRRAVFVLLPAVLCGCAASDTAQTMRVDPPPLSMPDTLNTVTGMRRLTEAQYRHSIADIFGPDIKVAGRFEPIVRPAHELIAVGSAESTISPVGLEQFDAMARNIAAQVLDKQRRDQFLSCAPADAAGADVACAGKVLAGIGRYVFRRPLTQRELNFYTKLAGDVADRRDDFYIGLELALSAMLVSPNFLYVVETAEPDPGVPGGMRLDNYARASRLSFLLWDTAPNETLLAAAGRGVLTDQKQLEAIVAGMIRSPRLEAGTRAFFSDMLVFEKFDEIAKDPVVYPRFNPDVAAALPEQMLRTLVDHLVTRSGDYRELFTTRRTFINRALGPIYQVPVAASQGWIPYEIPAGDDRAGLLGQAGFLALYSHSGRSSPTLRGRAVREVLMCQPVPNPPGNVNFTAVQETSNKERPTARVRLGLHTADPVCAGCHKITDPIGLPMERFDGIGVYRERENGAPIDVGGALESVSFTGVSGMGKAMASDPSITECLSRRGLEYLTGRSAEEDGDLIVALESGFAADGYKLAGLFYRLSTMPESFRVKHLPLGGHGPAVAQSNARERSRI